MWEGRAAYSGPTAQDLARRHRHLPPSWRKRASWALFEAAIDEQLSRYVVSCVGEFSGND